jgi:carbonic anhydrase
MTNVYNHIRNLQRELFAKLGFSASHMPDMGISETPEHNPEILLIGCVDARLDPHGDIGITKGKALIYRNIAALVAGSNGGAGDRLSVAAALEFAINSMHVKKIVVMGHTACGGIRAFLEGDSENTHYIHDYLMPLEDVRIQAHKKGESSEQQARSMERAAVRFSLENLMTYDVVRNAVAAGKLELTGWMLDTGNKLIWEMDPVTRKFGPMGALGGGAK